MDIVIEIFMKDIHEQIDFFFKEPSCKPEEKTLSTLYLLRRDILTCFGYDPNTMVQIPYQALWPGVMGILAGIDLLGKFLEGDDIATSVSYRFKKYYLKYCNNDLNESEVVYQLRNSLLHSFGLYSFKKKDKLKTEEFYFALDRNSDVEILKNLGSNRYCVNIIALKDSFERSVVNYQFDLRQYASMQDNFKKMFPFYLGIHFPERL